MWLCPREEEQEWEGWKSNVIRCAGSTANSPALWESFREEDGDAFMARVAIGSCGHAGNVDRSFFFLSPNRNFDRCLRGNPVDLFVPWIDFLPG